MKRVYLYLLFITLFTACSNKNNSKNEDSLSNGVSLTLAENRATYLSKIRYNLIFKIPNEKENPIQSNLVLDFNLNTVNAPVYLDFKDETSKIKSLSVNGHEAPINHKKEHLTLPKKLLREGSNTVNINFIAGELSLNRNEEFLYTLLVPDRARTLFPCFDQPNLKAVYNLKIIAPKNWTVLCGAPQVQQEENGAFITHTFAPSDKMSTYLFSFVAGKFETVKQKIGEFKMTLLYRETDSNKISYSTDSIFNLHHQAVSFLQDYTAYSFPFQKLDFAAIPGFQYGGMEHVGAIQYREDALFLDESATENRILSRAKLIAHETSHMWFGDLVTMDWFNDVWMKEVFANFMADKIVNPAFPKINHDLSFMTTHYPRAYGEDRTLGTNPIRQNLENLNNAGSLYGSIIYNKAPIMMRQLEGAMGKQAFQEGIQEYIKTYAYGNAVWNDLIQILDKKSEIDLEAWSEVWVNSSSRPIFTDSIVYNPEGRITDFKLIQNAEDNSKHIWPQTFDISLVYPDTLETITIAIKTKKQIIKQAIGKLKPLAVYYNSNGLGYGIFPIQEPILTTIGSISDEVTRGYTYINAYENTLTGAIEASQLLDNFLSAIQKEKNPILVNLLSGYIRSMYWKYLSNEQRTVYQPLLAEELWKELNSDSSSNLKKTIFNVFRSIAYSGNSLNQLYSIWKTETQIPNLKLNDDDYTELAMDLALYGHKESSSILSTAKEAITNPDKLERFEFLLASVSKDNRVKNEFFESLKSEKNRAKESWVATAMDNLNHPIHQKESISYLRPSLDLLDEIQKTGDIFFPKRWLNSTIGNYSSAEAYDIIQTFLEDNPDLNPSLKNKLLQASDDLRRVQLLHKKIDKSVN
ncbi:M1 family metallopeptidase [Maribacter sp. X9]|uniref:M1 family metallopeptidase n=1 Tax=Maribacter sp. X9 TaxID=3402159 RepID=UPI003AF4063A